MFHPDAELGTSLVMTSSRLHLKKGVWSEAEDLLLTKYIEKYGPGNWRQVPFRAGLNRCRKSCRLRWLNYLEPNIKRGEFEPDEVDLIIRMHNLLGNRWSLIAGRVPGRTANDIKNYYNTHLLKKKSRTLRLGKVKNNDMMLITKVLRPVPRKIYKKYQLIKNKAATPTWMNNNTNNINPTTTRFLPVISNDEDRTRKSPIRSVTDLTQNNNSALFIGSESNIDFHVEEWLKLQNDNVSNEDYFFNFNAFQGLEDYASHSGNCWDNDLYLGDDLFSML